MQCQNRRVFEVDFLRGVAIVLMVIFHFCFDLNYFGIVDINIYEGSFWKLFRTVIVWLFLTIVGISLVLAYKDGIDIKKITKRLMLLGFYALSISIVTYILFPSKWIYFGILHFIFFATIFGIFFVNYRVVSLIVGVSIIVLYWLGILHLKWLFALLKPLLYLPQSTLDIVRFFPWFGVVLIGIFLSN